MTPKIARVLGMATWEKQGCTRAIGCRCVDCHQTGHRFQSHKSHMTNVHDDSVCNKFWVALGSRTCREQTSMQNSVKPSTIHTWCSGEGKPCWLKGPGCQQQWRSCLQVRACFNLERLNRLLCILFRRFIKCLLYRN